MNPYARTEVLAGQPPNRGGDGAALRVRAANLPAMRYLNFDISESGDGVTTLEAMAATATAQHQAVMAEVQQALSWARRRFPHTEGPVDDGNDWQHELQVSVQDGVWHSVTLTFGASDTFVAEFLAEFGPDCVAPSV